MVHHPLTDKGIVTFRSDWNKARQTVDAKNAGTADASVRAKQAPRD